MSHKHLLSNSTIICTRSSMRPEFEGQVHAAKVGAEAFVKQLAQRALQIVAKCHARPNVRPNETESLLARVSYPAAHTATPRQPTSQPQHSSTGVSLKHPNANPLPAHEPCAVRMIFPQIPAHDFMQSRRFEVLHTEELLTHYRSRIRATAARCSACCCSPRLPGAPYLASRARA